MIIRKANLNEIFEIDKIYNDARIFMRKSGNLNQWSGGYPSSDTITSDILSSNLYVCCECEEILGVFFFNIGNDPTYEKIYDGKWLNDDKYGVIHRIAISDNARGKGVASKCFEFAFEKCNNIKIDTHRDNIPMQKALAKNGFKYCGIIHLYSGDERLAYQKTE